MWAHSLHQNNVMYYNCVVRVDIWCNKKLWHRLWNLWGNIYHEWSSCPPYLISIEIPKEG